MGRFVGLLALAFVVLPIGCAVAIAEPSPFGEGLLFKALVATGALSAVGWLLSKGRDPDD